MSDLVLSETFGPVRHVVLNRPGKRNAFDAELVAATGEALRAAAADPGVWVVAGGRVSAPRGRRSRRAGGRGARRRPGLLGGHGPRRAGRAGRAAGPPARGPAGRRRRLARGPGEAPDGR